MGSMASSGKVYLITLVNIKSLAARPEYISAQASTKPNTVSIKLIN